MWSERNARVTAASAEFRSAFAPEVAELQNPTRTEDIRDILVSGFTRHNEAAVIFRQDLGRFNRRGFDKAWQQYHSGHSIDADAWGIPKKEQLFLEYFSIQDESEAVQYALKKIDNLLLSYAKP